MRKLILIIFLCNLFGPSVKGSTNSCVQENIFLGGNINSNEDSLPSRPEIIDAALTYERFDYKTWEFINPIFKFRIKTERCDGFLSYMQNIFEGNSYEYEPVYERLSEDEYLIYDSYLGWDNTICFYACNKYGCSKPTKTIKVLDLIKDKNVLDTINNWLSVKNVTDSPMSYKLINGFLTVTGGVASIEVYNIEGLCIRRSVKEQTLDLHFLPKGGYIVRIKRNDNKTSILKIII